tara:strand:- start:562 stop:1704 length:1143 start_codon:yes stop_codon:yes gene_type:complete
MALGAFPIVGTAVVAASLASDLDMSLTLFGAGVALNTLFGGVFAPLSGRLSDRYGGKWSCVLVLVSSGLGLLVVALSRSALELILGLLISSYGQGACNPATNKLVAERAAPGRRGTMTGIKQSGVQLGILLGGFTLPALSIWVNWRFAMGLYAVTALLAATLAAAVLPDSHEQIAKESRGVGASQNSRLPRSVSLLALYALCMGCVVGGVGRYTVLFAENALDMSNVKAGLVAGLPGGLAIGTRIIWAHLAEHRIAPPKALAIQSFLTVLVMLMLCIAVGIGSWIMWPAAILSALGLNAWNAVAMLSVIIGVPQHQSGRASGRVVMGFMAGLTMGGFVTGLIADITGGYETAWAGLLVLSIMATLLAWRSSMERETTPTI